MNTNIIYVDKIHYNMDAIDDLLEGAKPEAKALFRHLVSRIEYLEDRISKNSRNSSKPPSSDGLSGQNRTKSLRTKSDKKPGGQKGHSGSCLMQKKEPDKILNHTVVNCDCCGKSLQSRKPDGILKRQVFELPAMKISVIEHQSEVKICPTCHTENRASFPNEVTQPVQYGPRAKAFAVYLMNQHFIPYQRTNQFFEDMFGSSLSEGSLLNFNKECFSRLESTEARIKEEIIDSPVAHFDETGMKLSGKTHWLHSSSTEKSTFYAFNLKRGKEGMDAIGILPNYQGKALHDSWASYFEYTCSHGLCNAHHLRELTFIFEEKGELWAQKMKKCLVGMYNSVIYWKERKDALPLKLQQYFEQKYDRILRLGFKYHKNIGQCISEPGKRGRKKQLPGKNLLDRLSGYKQFVLSFMYDFNVPFDNNLAERDIRMAKLKQKISGCYRSVSGAEYFCRIRGVISTLRKRNMNILESLQLTFLGFDPV